MYVLLNQNMIVQGLDIFFFLLLVIIIFGLPEFRCVMCRACFD